MMAAHDDMSAEDHLIARFFKPLATHPGALGLSDDAAFLTPPPGCDLVLKTDAIVGGVHFFPEDAAHTVASKALRVNLSDLAAKGAKPAGFLVTLALRSAEDAWLAPFARALGEDAAAYACPLLGGDTVSTPGPAMISIAAFGLIPAGRMIHRSGAKAGDRVMVTGTIGDAALGLDILKGGPAASALAGDAVARDMLISRYRVPQPRNALAAAVRDHASASMDVSDGLAGDFAKLCAASGVSADIDVPSIPLSAPARSLIASGAAAIETLISAGDDYEILCTVPDERCAAFADAARRAGVAVTSIGTIAAGTESPKFRDAEGRELALKHLSYSHF